jgi:recombination protein RecR
MAVSPTIDGETTVYYLSKKLAPYRVIISQIARGVAFGGELQYTDEITLGRSIMARLPYSVNGNS